MEKIYGIIMIIFFSFLHHIKHYHSFYISILFSLKIIQEYNFVDTSIVFLYHFFFPIMSYLHFFSSLSFLIRC